MVEAVEAMREKTFNIRFNDEEWARLDRVSKARGISAASLIRMLLKEADDKLAREVDVNAILAGPNTDLARRIEDSKAHTRTLAAIQKGRARTRSKATKK